MARISKLSVVIGFLTANLVLAGCQTVAGYFPYKFNSDTAQDEQNALQTDIAKHEFDLVDGQAMIGELAAVETKENDTLPDIARHFGIGYNDIAAANPAIPIWIPMANSRVLLPLQFILPDAPQKGIVLNVANMRMFYYPKKTPGKVYTYPIGIGRDGWDTPMGATNVAIKTVNPDWHVPASIQREHAAKGHFLPKVVRSGPDNPLGDYAMRLAFGSYLIHGTNKPYGIGMQISHGCIQMYPENIEILFKMVPVGTPVRIIHQPYMVAWKDNMLYLEANQPLVSWAGSKRQMVKQATKEIRRLAKLNNAQVDWAKVEQIMKRADGIPTPVLVNSPDVADLSKTAVQLVHPGELYGQPVAETLKDEDWAMLVATFDNEGDAKKLAAMLNHQGPPIPARQVLVNNAYQVVAGPFQNKKRAKEAASRIRFDFEINPELLEPRLPQTSQVNSGNL